MTQTRLTIPLRSPEATTRFAEALAPHLGAGDVLLLEGPVGAGKTAFARALVTALRARAGLPPEEVPSPTYTLVQTYETGAFPTWHADLYRLGDPSEILELGLDEAFREALCLIEWPDRLGALCPEGAALVSLEPGAFDLRTLTLTAPAALLSRLKPAFGLAA